MDIVIKGVTEEQVLEARDKAAAQTAAKAASDREYLATLEAVNAARLRLHKERPGLPGLGQLNRLDWAAVVAARGERSGE